jgi:HEAT repeat protein/putative zinc finger protein
MNCEQVKPQFADYLVRNLSEEANIEVQRHLTVCDPCRNELQILESTWTRLGTLPEQKPSPTMRARFYAALEAYQDQLQSTQAATKRRVTLTDWLDGWWPKRQAVQLATALLLFVVGLGMGRWLPPKDRSTEEMAHLRDELRDMRQLVTLSLLQQQSASERLKGVNWSYQIAQPDDRVVTALLETLNSDPNVNVRLGAVDALQQLAGHAGVRASLVQSLPRQESPIVQVALIDLLVELKEGRSAEVLRKLVHDNRLHKAVRARAETGLKQIS